MSTSSSAVVIEPSGERLTRTEFAAETARFAGALRSLGHVPGDTVVWLLENMLEFPVVAMGAARGGFDHLALNTHSTPAEVASILATLKPSVLVVSNAQLEREGMATALAELDSNMSRIVVGAETDGWLHYVSLLAQQPCNWDDLVADVRGKTLLLSGGSTGCPKIVVHSGGQNGALNSLSACEGDVQLVPQPLYHTGPLSIMMMALTAGASVVMMERWDSVGALQAIEGNKVSHLFVVPTMMSRLVKLPVELREAYDISSLRFVTHGAAPCPVEIKWAWLDWMPAACRTLEAYGMSEMFGMTAIDDVVWRRNPGSVGQPVGCRIVIRDEAGSEVPEGTTGVVWFVNDTDRTMEYLGNPKETRASYVVRNGCLEGTAFDLGYVKDGYLYLDGRLKDMVISGGANVYPVRAEEVLAAHPSVADVVVLGEPHEDLGEVLVAVVELVEGVEPEGLAAELIDFCRLSIAGFGAPRRVLFTQLPRIDTGKINKARVRELIGT